MYAQYLMKLLVIKKIVTEKIEKMWGLGTPEDLKSFLDK